MWVGLKGQGGDFSGGPVLMTLPSNAGDEGSVLCQGVKIPHAAAAKSLQSCPTLCNPIDGSPPGSPIPGILQARTLEWVAIAFPSAWKWKVKEKLLSRVWLFVTPWTAAYQAPLSMGFSRQVYWSGLPLPSPIQHASCPKKTEHKQQKQYFNKFIKDFKNGPH